MQTPYPLPMPDALWQYLRFGLGYLETSGKPCASSFVHDQGHAFGPVGLTRTAIRDCLERDPRLAGISFDAVIHSDELYDYVACQYADLILRRYLHIDYTRIPPAQSFEILQQAWYLGPTGYQRAKPLLASRQRKAGAFLARVPAPRGSYPAFLLHGLP